MNGKLFTIHTYFVICQDRHVRQKFTMSDNQEPQTTETDACSNAKVVEDECRSRNEFLMRPLVRTRKQALDAPDRTNVALDGKEEKEFDPE